MPSTLHRSNPIFLRFALLAALALGGMLAAMAQEAGSQVQARDGRTRQDGRVAQEASDVNRPDGVSYSGEGATRTMEIRKTLRPPAGFRFDRFRESEKDAGRISEARRARTPPGNDAWSYWDHVPSYVDFWFDPETALLIQETPSTVHARADSEDESSISIRAVLLMPQTAAEFPLRCDGNLKSIVSGGGGGPAAPPPEKHWASRIAGGIQLHIDADNNSASPNWAPQRSPDERALRNLADKPGRLIAVNNADRNTNGIPDFVEMKESGAFVVMEIDLSELGGALDLTSSTLTFSYPDSNPDEDAFTSSDHLIAGVTVKERLPERYGESGLPRVRLWTKDGPVPRNPTAINQAGDYIPAGKAFPASKLAWSNHRARVYIEGISAGTASIQAHLQPAGWPPGTKVDDIVKVTVVDIGLRPDRNRDRKIDAADRIARLRWPIYRFWKNNDQDKAGQPIMEDGDYLVADDKGNAQKNLYIDGIRDLIDFFPLHIDIGQALVALKQQDIQPLVLLKQADGALNMGYWLQGMPGTAGKYHETIGAANAILSLHSPDRPTPFPLAHISSNGSDFWSVALRRALETNNLVTLMEGRTNTVHPLVLEVRNPENNALILECRLPLQISSTMEMMQWRTIAGPGVGISGTTGEPPNAPKAETNGRLAVFVHGFLEDDSTSMGHASAVFKRLYWAGMNTGFAAVRWPGNLRPGGSGGRRATLHYQMDVQSALEKASMMANHLTSFKSNWDGVSVIAHSLGNMIVSQAIMNADAGVVDRYLMLNAAVPIEAYAPPPVNGEDIDQLMIHRGWRGYKPHLYCSEWWRLFNEDDARSQLSWRGRFAGLADRTQVYNAYSPTEDVLFIRDAAHVALWETVRNVYEKWFHGRDMGGGAWQSQEVWKGRDVFGIIALTHDYGGWGFSLEWRYLEGYGLIWDERQPGERPIPPHAALEIPPADLRSRPLFKRRGSRSDVARNIPDGLLSTSFAADAYIGNHEAELLARMIPAISGPAGSREVPEWETEWNIDMNQFRNSPWPRSQPGQPWWHRDHRRPAYVYVNRLYTIMANDQHLNLK